MRTIDIQSFTDLDDALWWLEEKLHEMVDEDIKAELVLVNNQWRVSVITDTSQGELFETV